MVEIYLVMGLKTLTLVLGGLITFLAYRAYSRTGDRSLGFLAVGFAIVTCGTFLAGVADQVLQADLQIGLIIESSLVTVGFLFILYSLYTTAE